VREIHSMELSVSKDYVLLCGSSRYETGVTGEGVIAALEFNSSLNTIFEQVIPATLAKAYTSMRRIEGSDKFVVGAEKELFLLEVIGDKVMLLKKYGLIHSGTFSSNKGPICDICVQSGKIFSICRTDEYIAITDV